MSQDSFDGLDWINFKASGLDFIESESKTGRFLGLSVVFHATLFVLASLIAIPIFEPKKIETISFDFLEAGAAPMTPVGASASASPVAAVSSLKISSSTVEKSVATALPKGAPKIVTGPATKAPKTIAVVQDSEVSVPQSLDDIEAPQLDEEAVSSAPIAAMDDKDFSEDIQAINAKSRKQVALAQQQLAEQTAEIENETNQGLSAAEAANKMESESLGLAAAALRAKNSQDESQGASKIASKPGSTGGGGIFPRGIVIRAIQDLRQLPGNPRPEYNSDERLKGNQGRATFLAYVSKGGRLSSFKLGQSTGHRNLDLKTLTALKQWRFYPGQEGWVEIPIQWDLRGGTQEKPTLLRRTNI